MPYYYEYSCSFLVSVPPAYLLSAYSSTNVYYWWLIAGRHNRRGTVICGGSSDTEEEGRLQDLRNCHSRSAVCRRASVARTVGHRWGGQKYLSHLTKLIYGTYYIFCPWYGTYIASIYRCLPSLCLCVLCSHHLFSNICAFSRWSFRIQCRTTSKRCNVIRLKRWTSAWCWRKQFDAFTITNLWAHCSEMWPSTTDKCIEFFIVYVRTWFLYVVVIQFAFLVNNEIFVAICKNVVDKNRIISFPVSIYSHYYIYIWRKTVVAPNVQ